MRPILLFAVTTAYFTGAAGTQPVYTEADFAADIVHKLLLRQKEIISLKGYAELTHISGEKARTFRVGFARVPPAKTRLEITGPFGDILLTVTADGNRMMAYSKNDNMAIVCETTRENLVAITGIDLGADIHRVVDWVEGRVPTYAETVATGEVLIKATENANGSATVTWVHNGDGIPVQTITFDPYGNKILFGRIFGPNGKAETDIYYNSFLKSNGFLIPETITVNTEEASFGVHIERIKTNEEIKETAFSTKPPEGAETYYWDSTNDVNNGNQ